MIYEWLHNDSRIDDRPHVLESHLCVTDIADVRAPALIENRHLSDPQFTETSRSLKTRYQFILKLCKIVEIIFNFPLTSQRTNRVRAQHIYNIDTTRHLKLFMYYGESLDYNYVVRLQLEWSRLLLHRNLLTKWLSSSSSASTYIEFFQKWCVFILPNDMI